MHQSHVKRLLWSILAGIVTFYTIKGSGSLLSPAAQYWILAALCLPVAFITLGLVLFFFVQMYETWTKDGTGAALALAFTSIVIFPVATILEAIENLVFPPLGFPATRKSDQRELVLVGGKFAHLEGMVYHLRTEQAVNDFKYRVNYTLVPLDRPPSSFEGDYMTAPEARAFANTDGPVLLLTDLKSVGYHQNPISVYFCYTLASDLNICIAEVTNTPWGEKVHFLFDPKGDVVPKSMHVSPFVDMNRCWKLVASPPALLVGESAQSSLGDAKFKLSPASELLVTVIPNCSTGANLNAVMKMRPRVVMEGRGSWSRVQDYFMPQRVALRIYWQAIVLLIKGVKYCPHPRDLDEKAYVSLVTRPGSRAQKEGKVRRRPFVFTEFAVNNSRTTRLAHSNTEVVKEGSHSGATKLEYYDGQAWKTGH